MIIGCTPALLSEANPLRFFAMTQNFSSYMVRVFRVEVYEDNEFRKAVYNGSG
jgi:hypothetical protein